MKVGEETYAVAAVAVMMVVVLVVVVVVVAAAAAAVVVVEVTAPAVVVVVVAAPAVVVVVVAAAVTLASVMTMTMAVAVAVAVAAMAVVAMAAATAAVPMVAVVAHRLVATPRTPTYLPTFRSMASSMKSSRPSKKRDIGLPPTITVVEGTDRAGELGGGTNADAEASTSARASTLLANTAIAKGGCRAEEGV